MKLKHTPGPWIVDESITKRNGRIYAHTRITPHNSESEICEIFTANYEDSVSEANARLIAAAPEMLSMLKVILLNIEEGNIKLKVHPDENGHPNHPDKKLQALKSLVAKTEGRES